MGNIYGAPGKPEDIRAAIKERDSKKHTNVPNAYPFSEFGGYIKGAKSKRQVNPEFGNLIFCWKAEKDILMADARRLKDDSSEICKQCFYKCMN